MLKNIYRLLSVCSVFILSACSNIGIMVANMPTHFDDVQVSRNVSFGEADWEKMDIYAPAGTTKNSKLPVVVFFYGGRWESGSKDEYKFVGSSLAKQNFIVVIPDYRKYPDVKFPTFVEDGAKSLAWVSDHISQYGGDAGKINLSGHSAGGHIAALLSTDSHYLKAYGKDRSIIHSFVGLAGPYSFTPDENDLIDMFGPASNYPKMQATTFIDGKQPPMLLLWGDKDTFVGKFNMDRLVKAINDKGGCVEEKVYPEIDHVWLAGALSWIGKGKAPVLSDMVRFMNKPCLKP